MGQMTRKDYELVADTVRLSKDMMPLIIPKIELPEGVEASFDIPEFAKRLSFAATEYIAGNLANAFKEQNPSFDIDRFLRDCGVRDD